MKLPDAPQFLFAISLSVALIAYGFLIASRHVFPYSILKFGRDSVVQVLEDRETITGTRPTQFLTTARHDGRGVTLARRDRMAPGLTLLVGFFEGGNQLRLIRADGSVVARWPVKFYDIFENTDHVQPQYWVPATDWNVELHGAMLLPDGSAVFNFEHRGMVKLDRCGAVQWKIPRMTHHAIEPAAGGGFWVPGVNYVTDRARFPFVELPYTDDLILKVSADGKITKEVSVLGLFHQNDMLSLLTANGMAGIRLSDEEVPGEYTHLNDIEELSPAMAVHFPEFAAGDLLLSLRDFNLVVVVDPGTQQVKWHQTGPWIGQHDPDFAASGRITVFNNNSDNTPTGEVLQGSTIVEVDPVTHESTVKYGDAPSERMYSEIRGKHQNLDNGNLLITESQAGHVFEVDAHGKMVWEFVNRYDDESTALVTQATRYPADYFTVTDWSCQDGQP